MVGLMKLKSQGIFSRYPPGVREVKPRLYAAIDRATSEYLSAPNLAQNMDVVSVINSAVDPVYASTKTCKRICLRLRTRNQRVQYVSLQLLEYCVASCGEAYHSQLAKSDLLNNQLSRMADRSIWCASEIQRMILALVQKWAYEIQYPQFSTLYNRLKQKGLPFEPRAEGEKRFQPYPGLPSSPVPPEQNGKHAFSGGAAPTTGPNRPPSRGTAHLGADLLRPQRSTDELTSDLEVARGTVALLNDVLNGAEKDGTWESVKEEYCVEVAGACQSLTDRLAALLGSGVTNESIVSAALEINDDAQRALDRRLALIEIADGKRPAPQIARKKDDEPKVAPEKEKTSEKQVETEKKKVVDEPPLLDLLDLDWTPAPVQDSAGKEAPGVTIAPPAQLPQVQLNNPFAPAPQQPASSLSDKEFSPPLPPATAPPAPSSSTDPQLQAGAGGGAQAPNPFLSDDAFAQLSREPEPQRTQQPASAQQTGNPFAMEEVRPTAADGPVVTSAASKRPPSLIVPGSDAADSGFYPSLGPQTAPPAFYAPPSAGFLPSSMPLPGNATPHPYTSTGAAYPYHHQQYQPIPNQQYASMPMPDYGSGPSQNLSASAYGSYPSAYPPSTDTYSSGGFGAYGTPIPQNQSPGVARPSDAFGDLVAMTARRQEPPPPPKGSPMRTDGVEVSAGGQGRPASGQQAAVPPRSGADAFDAFDVLAGQR